LARVKDAGQGIAQTEFRKSCGRATEDLGASHTLKCVGVDLAVAVVVYSVANFCGGLVVAAARSRRTARTQSVVTALEHSAFAGPDTTGVAHGKSLVDEAITVIVDAVTQLLAFRLALATIGAIFVAIDESCGTGRIITGSRVAGALAASTNGVENSALTVVSAAGTGIEGSESAFGIGAFAPRSIDTGAATSDAGLGAVGARQEGVDLVTRVAGVYLRRAHASGSAAVHLNGFDADIECWVTGEASARTCPLLAWQIRQGDIPNRASSEA
jgi:hypothetical protein